MCRKCGRVPIDLTKTLASIRRQRAQNWPFSAHMIRNFGQNHNLPGVFQKQLWNLALIGEKLMQPWRESLTKYHRRISDKKLLCEGRFCLHSAMALRASKARLSQKRGNFWKMIGSHNPLSHAKLSGFPHQLVLFWRQYRAVGIMFPFLQVIVVAKNAARREPCLSTALNRIGLSAGNCERNGQSRSPTSSLGLQFFVICRALIWHHLD